MTRSLQTVNANPPEVLQHGQFFGSAHREARTDSFTFASMVPTWPEGEVPLHSHENAYFMFVLSGMYITAASEELCPAPAAIYNPSGTTHRDRFHSRSGEFLTISVAKPVADEIERTLKRPTLLRDPRILLTLADACLELKRRDATSELCMESLGLELAGRVALLADLRDKRLPAWLARTRDMIKDCHASSLTNAQLARAADVHPVHLARAFRQYFNCSPGDYLRACRLDRALELLRRSRLSLAEVALEAGYCDQSHLTNALRRARRRTPSRLRRAFQ
jgi:AraC family transcriptional regulator